MKEHWRSIEELRDKGLIKREIKEEEISDKNALWEVIQNGEQTKASRRDFLKLWGFGISAAALASSCQRPVQKAIPYLIKPEEVVPGMSSHYATTFFDGDEYASLLVKSRDGRPIKIEGNELSRISGGSTSARVQASLLNLYDNTRYSKPVIMGQPYTYDELDRIMLSKLESVSSDGGKVVLVTPTIISPSTKEVIRRFLDKYKGSEQIVYDASSSSAVLEANAGCFGSRVIPAYRFDKAKVIVSFFADFLGTWLMPVQYTRQYVSGRDLTNGQKSLLYHIQLESGMSLTGSNADKRIAIRPSDERAILMEVYAKLCNASGKSYTYKGTAYSESDHIVQHLLAAKGESLVLSSTNDLSVQVLVNAINLLLGNYEKTIDLQHPLLVKQGDDREMERLVSEMNGNKVGILILWNVNPLYDYAGRDNFREALKHVPLKLTLASGWNETSRFLNSVVPDSHYLEKWNDAEPVKNSFSLAQPLISPIFETRQAEETLMKWAVEGGSYYDFIRQNWKTNLFNKQKNVSDFETFWDNCLQGGIYEPEIKSGEAAPKPNEAYISGILDKTEILKAKGPYELSLYYSVAIGTGKFGNNPWLYEMPDPVSRVSWDNFIAIAPRMADEKGIKTGDLLKLSNGLILPAFVQPGQANGTVSIALGYGRNFNGKPGTEVGVDVTVLCSVTDGFRLLSADGIDIEHTGSKTVLALTQTHNSMEGRPIVRETELANYVENASSGNEMHEEFEKEHQTLYPDIKIDGYQWHLTVDLNSCIGCGACTIACQAENNIPVVGKEQVIKRRIMHWIRIDRYYTGEPENPEVLFQPVMCQHCGNAPCENVCPVGATSHSSEGLNQMAYNRCIGTKYCINNCPYRVRRFNWFRYVTNKAFDFNENSDIARMALNPDVTVRERGVVEKCTFCVQRIQEKKLKAKSENRALKDGEIQTACVQVCPAKALTFGNYNDKGAKVTRLFDGPRRYGLLEDLHTLPSVGYLTKVRNSKA